jgi:hypothetical protein
MVVILCMPALLQFMQPSGVALCFAPGAMSRMDAPELLADRRVVAPPCPVAQGSQVRRVEELELPVLHGSIVSLGYDTFRPEA